MLHRSISGTKLALGVVVWLYFPPNIAYKNQMVSNVFEAYKIIEIKKTVLKYISMENTFV